MGFSQIDSKGTSIGKNQFYVYFSKVSLKKKSHGIYPSPPPQ